MADTAHATRDIFAVVPASEPGAIRRDLAFKYGGRDLLLIMGDRDYGSRLKAGTTIDRLCIN